MRSARSAGSHSHRWKFVDRRAAERREDEVLGRRPARPVSAQGVLEALVKEDGWRYSTAIHDLHQEFLHTGSPGQTEPDPSTFGFDLEREGHEGTADTVQRHPLGR